MTGIKVCLFGDSFIKLFSLMKHEQMEVIGFTGATARGLRILDRAENNDQHAAAAVPTTTATAGRKTGGVLGAKQVMQARLDSSKPQDDVFFNFGQVDVHLSYYYKKYKKQEAIDLDKIATDYVDCVATLRTQGTARKTIIGLYPSAPDDDYVKVSLVKYGAVTQGEAALISDKDVSLASRQARVLRFNQVLQETCAKHGILYVDAFEEMTTGNNSSNTGTGATTPPPRLQDMYRDVSDYNIHVVWETTLLMWMHNWPWLALLAPPGFEKKLQQTFKMYRKTKPWAKSTHQHHLDINDAVVRNSSSSSSTTTRTKPEPKKKMGRFSRENLL